jgi:hypothetical protein
MADHKKERERAMSTPEYTEISWIKTKGLQELKSQS